MLICPKCRGRLSANVEITNLAGNLGFKIDDNNSIGTCVTSIVPHTSKITVNGFYCLHCDKTILEKDIKLECSYSGEFGDVEDFYIVVLKDIKKDFIISTKLVIKREIDNYKDSVLRNYPAGMKKNIDLELNTPKISKTIIRKG